MKIVVTTPTGNVGSRVARLLVQAGVRPTLLLRDAGRLEPELRDLVDVAEGDQADADFVVAATRDTAALFWVDPPTDDGDPLASYARMTASVARAVAENAIPRTVFQSSVGAELRHGAGEIDGLAGTEVALDGLETSVVHLRCGYFFTNLLLDLDSLRSGTISTTLPLDQPMGWVDPRDIGDIAVARLLSTDWSGRIVQAVHGPADLGYGQVAEILTDALGRPVTAVQVSDDDVREVLRGSGLTEQQIEAIVGMSAGLREGFRPENPRTLLTTTPTGLGGWAREHLLPLL